MLALLSRGNIPSWFATVIPWSIPHSKQWYVPIQYIPEHPNQTHPNSNRISDSTAYAEPESGSDPTHCWCRSLLDNQNQDPIQFRIRFKSNPPSGKKFIQIQFNPDAKPTPIQYRVGPQLSGGRMEMIEMLWTWKGDVPEIGNGKDACCFYPLGAASPLGLRQRSLDPSHNHSKDTFQFNTFQNVLNAVIGIRRYNGNAYSESYSTSDPTQRWSRMRLHNQIQEWIQDAIQIQFMRQRSCRTLLVVMIIKIKRDPAPSKQPAVRRRYRGPSSPIPPPLVQWSKRGA